jgi:hypothetical protein
MKSFPFNDAAKEQLITGRTDFFLSIFKFSTPIFNKLPGHYFFCAGSRKVAAAHQERIQLSSESNLFNYTALSAAHISSQYGELRN